MPRTRRSTVARAERVTPQHALVAAATNYSKTPIKSTAAVTGEAYSIKRSPKKPSSETWQTTAWTFYDTIGEYRYAVDWVGNLLSRVKLIVTKDGEPTEDAKAVDLLDALFAGPEGQSEMLRLVGKHWTVTGDCFVIGDKWDTDDPDWLVAANTVTSVNQDGDWKVNEETFKKSALAIRLWRPHPTNRSLADSPARAVLPILAEVDGLTKHVAAQIDSRLAGAGILFVPDTMTFSSAQPEKPAADDPDNTEPAAPVVKNGVDDLVKTLIEVMSTAIADREDPNALVPIVISADGEAIRNVKYQTFSTELDKKAIELRTEAIRRLALGMDMPPEVLMGTADVNHWNSWQIEEAAIKAHLEPLLEELCAALTDAYLRPSLDGKDAASYAIAADTAALRLRPNRSKEAIELYNLGRLNEVTMLTENGFDPKADAMNDEQLKRWLLIKIAGGSATPEQVLAALDALGLQLNVQAPAQAPADSQGTPAADEEPRESRPAPSTKDHPTRMPPNDGDPVTEPGPDTATSVQSEALVAAAGVMVHRALERAGNKLATKLGGKISDGLGGTVPAAQAYTRVRLDPESAPMRWLLEDAWGSCAVFAPDLGVEPTWLARSLDVYTRDLIVRQKPHTLAGLRTHLALTAA